MGQFQASATYEETGKARAHSHTCNMVQHTESPRGLRWRLVFAVLGAMGMAIIYGLKVNLSVAIVAMINHTDLALQSALLKNETQEDDGHSDHDKASSAEDGPFSWTEPQQGLVLGSYFWGYLVTQIPGGRLAELFGGKWVFFVAVVLNVVPTLLSPVCSYAGYEYLIVMRIVEGLGGGVTFPAMNVLIAKWAPSAERSSIASIVYGGTALGTVISIPTSGLIAGTLGWEWVFYLHGGLSLVWCVLWTVFVTDSPVGHKFISQEERDFICVAPGEGSAGDHDGGGHGAPVQTGKPLPVPWLKMLTSVPVWAIIIGHTCNNFGWYMLLVELPLFMRTGLGFDIKQNAGLSTVPFLCNWLFSLVYSNRLDWAHSKGYINRTWMRKLSMLIASVIPACCLIGVCLSGDDKTAVVVLMIVATMFYGSMFSGVFSNHVDIAKNFAGVLMGISNMCATVPGFGVPAFVGLLTHGKTGLGPWHIVFYTTAGVLALEVVVYTWLASGVEQEWNTTKVSLDHDPESEDKDERNGTELKNVPL